MYAIGYVRCSTQEQADSGLGLQAQAERIRAYCALKNLRLLEVITDAGPTPWSCSSSTACSATRATA